MLQALRTSWLIYAVADPVCLWPRLVSACALFAPAVRGDWKFEIGGKFWSPGLGLGNLLKLLELTLGGQVAASFHWPSINLWEA